jgi:hypothetical protein
VNEKLEGNFFDWRQEVTAFFLHLLSEASSSYCPRCRRSQHHHGPNALQPLARTKITVDECDIKMPCGIRKGVAKVQTRETKQRRT